VTRVRVAVVGAGRMGRTHVEALASCRRALAVAVVEPDDAARAAVSAPGVAAHRDVDSLLAAGGFDAALIAAPTDLHLGLVRRLAAAGVPVLCEKPCGLGAADAQAAADAGGLLQVGYWRRFVPALQRLRERLRSGALGEPTLVISHQWDEQPPPPGFRAHSGGIAIDMAVHEIDQIRWLLGQEFGAVAAVGGAPGGDPDTAVAVGRLSGGAVATITLGRRFPPGDTCWLELFATEGYERIASMASPDDFVAALAAQADAFAAAVAGEPRQGAGGEDAVAALQVAERIDHSLTSAGGA
jgi:myo-inositol 2-dehydrogenase / D-chiro-inositol 1-dehydrogenase